MNEIKLVVGLGNPGAEYAGTRHNMGFMTVAVLLEKLNSSFTGISRYESEIFTGQWKARTLTIQRPTTYMNRSGEAVRKLMTASGVLPSELLVVYDDLDIDFGRLRLRENGSSGGHKGMESIISELGTDQFSRLRVGIGGAEKDTVVDYVLSAFPAGDMEKLTAVLSAAAMCVQLALVRGVPEAMNRYNHWIYKTTEEQKSDGPAAPPSTM
ncbi:MAG: aminoacyl-tRNA hydrolase [Victivallaceae bacterium]|nr:aminoacyl-tRNA hydrolase [Victivallaceae bacterium]